MNKLFFLMLISRREEDQRTKPLCYSCYLNNLNSASFIRLSHKYPSLIFYLCRTTKKVICIRRVPVHLSMVGLRSRPIAPVVRHSTIPLPEATCRIRYPLGRLIPAINLSLGNATQGSGNRRLLALHIYYTTN